MGSLQSRMASLVLGRLHVEGGDEQEVRANSSFPYTKAAAGTTSISTKLPMSQPAGLAGHTRWGEEVLVTGWEGGEETGKMALFLNRKSAVQGVSF